jgi:hypothetical protein
MCWLKIWLYVVLAQKLIGYVIKGAWEISSFYKIHHHVNIDAQMRGKHLTLFDTITELFPVSIESFTDTYVLDVGWWAF